MHLYPAKATIGEKVVRNLRLLGGPNGAVVWEMDKVTGDVRVLVRSDSAPQRVGATGAWQVADVVIEPQRGCGCNHPMYRWVPPAEVEEALA